jgi:hypothetical protein
VGVDAVRRAVRRTLLVNDLQDLHLTQEAEKDVVLTAGQRVRLKALRAGKRAGPQTPCR